MSNKILRKLAKFTPVLFVLVFIGLQFVPTPAASKTSTHPPHKAEMIDPHVGQILDRSCQDCHSSRTTWPWYSHVAPISWVISKHVIEGRETMDFSAWTSRPPTDDERMLVCLAVSDGSMPLHDYTAIHRKARLSKKDVKTICDWANAPSLPLTPTQVGKLNNNK